MQSTKYSAVHCTKTILGPQPHLLMAYKTIGNQTATLFELSMTQIVTSASLVL